MKNVILSYLKVKPLQITMTTVKTVKLLLKKKNLFNTATQN